MIDIDTRNIDKLQRQLKTFGKKTYPKIQGATLNKAAFETRGKYVKAVRRKMILRNKWTERSIRFDKVKGFNPRNQMSVVGSVADYMEAQEFGATIRKSGKKGVDIPTSSASGEGMSQPRRKVVRRANRRRSITLARRRIRAKTKQQYIVASIKAAAASGGRNKFVYLPFDRHPGIYKVVGGKRRPRIVLIHDFSRPSVVIQPRRPLKQSVDAVAPRIPRMFIKQASFHLERAGLS
jgi:hypothetical protein